MLLDVRTNTQIIHDSSKINSITSSSYKSHKHVKYKWNYCCRSSVVFEVRLVMMEDEQIPSKLEHPVTFKIPVDSAPLQSGQVLQVSNCSL